MYVPFKSTLNYLRGHLTSTWTEFCHFLRGQFLYPDRGQKQTFLNPFPPPPHLVHVVIEWPLTVCGTNPTLFEIGSFSLLHPRGIIGVVS